jgi:excisionase family DNA binding protein
MAEDDELTLPEIAQQLGLNLSTPRAWVTRGRLPAHRDDTDPRRWLVYRRDLDAMLSSARADAGRPRGRGAVETTTREDWGDAPEQATLNLASSIELPGART